MYVMANRGQQSSFSLVVHCVNVIIRIVRKQRRTVLACSLAGEIYHTTLHKPCCALFK